MCQRAECRKVLHSLIGGVHMIDTRESVITEALAVIDKALAEMFRRELVSSTEMADLLLDLRSLLTSSDASTTAGA